MEARAGMVNVEPPRGVGSGGPIRGTQGHCQYPFQLTGGKVAQSIADHRNLAERLPGQLQTNNRAELLAIIRALESCPFPQLPLEIRTDSQYSIACPSSISNYSARALISLLSSLLRVPPSYRYHAVPSKLDQEQLRLH